MRISVRLAPGLSRLAGTPQLSVEVADGATVEDLLARVGEQCPALADGLPSALPVVRGEHALRDRALADHEEVALLLPAAGGAPHEQRGEVPWQ